MTTFSLNIVFTSFWKSFRYRWVGRINIWLNLACLFKHRKVSLVEFNWFFRHLLPCLRKNVALSLSSSWILLASRKKVHVRKFTCYISELLDQENKEKGKFNFRSTKYIHNHHHERRWSQRQIKMNLLSFFGSK